MGRERDLDSEAADFADSVGLDQQLETRESRIELGLRMIKDEAIDLQDREF